MSKIRTISVLALAMALSSTAAFAGAKDECRKKYKRSGAYKSCLEGTSFAIRESDTDDAEELCEKEAKLEKDAPQLCERISNDPKEVADCKKSVTSGPRFNVAACKQGVQYVHARAEVDAKALQDQIDEIVSKVRARQKTAKVERDSKRTPAKTVKPDPDAEYKKKQSGQYFEDRPHLGGRVLY